MINRRQFVSTALGAAAVPHLARAQNCPASSGSPIVEPTAAQVESIARKYLPTLSSYIGGAIGYASPSFGAHVVCIGSLVNQKGSPIAFNTDTPFEIASITKTVTASVYRRMIQIGRVGIKDTLGKYISREVSSQIRAIPLADLANYTSGLPADDHGSNGTLPSSLNGNYTQAELFSFLANPTFPIVSPGTTYTYSNLGFSLLAIALQTAAGAASFGALTNNEILGPLGMVKTQAYSSSLGAQFPLGLDSSGEAAATGWPPFPAYLGAGGLISTPNEMMTWLQFSMGIIQSGTLNEILSSSPATAAGVTTWLGWFESTIQNSSGSRLTILQKNGDLSGFSSQIAILPPQSNCATSPAGVFAMVNGGNGTATQNSAATDIAYDLMLTIAGL